MQNLVGAPTPDQSFWSIAVEAQLYVVFPLLLLMVRRWGAVVMVAAVTLVVATVGILAPHVSRLDVFVIQSPPDLAALFAVGVVSAGIVGASAARRSWPWAGLALAAAAPVLAMIGWRGSVWTLDHLFWVDLALGPAVACLLAGLATGRPAPLLRLLDARPIRNLGASSYSLYLTHGPIVVVVYEKIVAGRVRQGVPAFVVSLALVLPLTIVFARVFASVFETPFRRSRSRSTSGAAAVEVEQLRQVADRAQPVARRGGRAVRVVAGPDRRRVVEGVVARGERGQAVQALDQLERRDVLGGPARGDDAPAAQQRRDHPERHADAQAVRVDLRRRDVVEEAAVLVVGEQERRAGIERRRAQRLDEPAAGGASRSTRPSAGARRAGPWSSG